jgi:uncharacterized protein YggE
MPRIMLAFVIVALVIAGVSRAPARGAGANYLAAKAAPPTPIEVGEEEIRAQVQAVFLVSP